MTPNPKIVEQLPNPRRTIATTWASRNIIDRSVHPVPAIVSQIAGFRCNESQTQNRKLTAGRLDRIWVPHPQPSEGADFLFALPRLRISRTLATPLTPHYCYPT